MMQNGRIIDYSLLIMVASGMMKMANGDDFPHRRSAGTGSILVFHGSRGLRRRNFWSRVISGGFCIYRIFWCWFQAKMGLKVSTTHLGAPGPPGAPMCLAPYSWIFSPSHGASSASFVPKKSSKSFVAFGELRFLHKKQHHGSFAENNVSLGWFHANHTKTI